MRASQPSVLIIDDNQADRELIATLLSDRYSLLFASNANQGLEVYRAEHPDCVLLDHHLPGTAGLDALRLLTASGAVVIMLTSSGSDDLSAEAFKRGARDYVLKSGLNRGMLGRIITRELERSRLELDLQATRDRFDEVAARIPEVLWMRGLDAEFLYLSPAFHHVWGLPAAGTTAAQWRERLHPDDRTRVMSTVCERMRTSKEYEIEFRIVRPDGAIRKIRDRGYPIFESGELVRFGGIARDVTEEVRMLAELRLAQKLEAIGQLAAGVAHEINTPAQYVSDNISFLSEGFRDLMPLLSAVGSLGDAAESADAESGPHGRATLVRLAGEADLEYLLAEIPAALEQAASGIGQIKRIVMAMKEFSHPGDDMTSIDLNHIIQNTVTVARNEWKYVADIEFDLDEDLPSVVCLPSEINQVVMNLVVNAAHAIGDVVAQSGGKGTIRVRTRRDGDAAVIEIEDSGCGIPEAMLERIFDPFFTTKEPGKGTGQGLAIAHRIVVEHHRGAIRAASDPGKGSCFSIHLPLEPAPRQALAV